MRAPARTALAVCLGLATTAVVTTAVQQPRTQPAIFTFETDEFWLNLHHFLYVLGRADAKMPDATDPSVVNAPGEAARGLATLTDAERTAWAESVKVYAAGYSRQNLVFDEALAAVTRALGEADDRPTLDGIAVEPAARNALERAAPVYRKAWWPAHKASNEAFRSMLQGLVARYGRQVLVFVTQAYREPWPAAGFPAHLSTYVQRGGNYSTYGNLLVVSTNPEPAHRGTLPLEIIFHEAMHQWDDAMLAALQAQGLKLEGRGPENLTHAMIWLTAGDAVRRVVPEHVPYADASRIWNGRDVGPFKAALEATWRPYLDGRGTRDEALRALVASVASATPPAAAPQAQARSLFRIETDEFWLNMHQFLYVLGRARAGNDDATREAVVDAPVEAERGLQALSAEERQVWAEAVTAYSTGLSQRDAVRGAPMPEITAALAEADDAGTLAGVAIDAAVRETLERAAPVYRKAWWPAHRAANQAWRTSIEQLVARHGATVLSFVSRAYGLPWPGTGFAVHAARYSNWGGAYSSVRGVLVIASGYAGNEGLRGLEGVFHEGMHQWDGQVYRLLGDLAKPINATVPSDMPHALIWVTAGAAIRRLDPAYVPTVDALSIWNLASSGMREPLGRLKVALEETWLPYLAGRGRRDEALTALLAKIPRQP